MNTESRGYPWVDHSSISHVKSLAPSLPPQQPGEERKPETVRRGGGPPPFSFSPLLGRDKCLKVDHN